FFIVVFRPPPGNQFGATEKAVAAYIFATDLDERSGQVIDILFLDEHCQGDRGAFWTLHPRHEVINDMSL
ncbi:hypothetical protein HN51_051656, partial [Arachis hypogaea]